MDKININYSPKNNHIINFKKDKESNVILESKIIFMYDSILKEFNSKMTLQDLKTHINNKYSIQDNEFELLIGNNPIHNLPNNTLILNLLNKYNENVILLKSHKSSFDALKQLNSYEKYLAENISLKEDEINLLNIESNKLMEELNSI